MIYNTELIIDIIGEFLLSTYGAKYCVYDKSFRANTYEVHPSTSGGFQVILYKNRDESENWCKMFGNLPTDSIKAINDVAKTMEDYLNTKAEALKNTVWKVTPGLICPGQYVTFKLMPDADIVYHRKDFNNEQVKAAMEKEVEKQTGKIEKKQTKSTETVINKKSPQYPENSTEKIHESIVSQFLSFKEGDIGASVGMADGCTSASDIAGSVPDNMGAVVKSDKKDKKYSDIFKK